MKFFGLVAAMALVSGVALTGFAADEHKGHDTAPTTPAAAPAETAAKTADAATMAKPGKKHTKKAKAEDKKEDTAGKM